MKRIILSTILCLLTTIVSLGENKKVTYQLIGSGITKKTVTFDTTTTNNSWKAPNKPKVVTEQMKDYSLIEKEFGKEKTKQLKLLSKIKTEGAVCTVIGTLLTVTGATLMIVGTSTDYQNNSSTSSYKSTLDDLVKTADKKHKQFVLGTICLGLSIPISSIGISKVTYSNIEAAEIFYY